jgi:uroporphyrinogen-III synthase
MFPLQGKRILVLRAQHQASDLADALQHLGATVIRIPVIAITEPRSYAALDQALAQLQVYDWLIFTSANAVEVFQRRRAASAPPPNRIAAIGPATAKAIQKIGLHVDLIPPKHVAESLADAMTEQVCGKKVLLIRAEEARDVLPDALNQAGAELTIASAYRNQVPAESISAIQELFSAPALVPDVVALTSASTVRNLFSLTEAAGTTIPPTVVFASIGPITSASLREEGYEPTVEAKAASIPDLVEAITDYFTQKTRL